MPLLLAHHNTCLPAYRLAPSTERCYHDCYEELFWLLIEYHPASGNPRGNDRDTITAHELSEVRGKQRHSYKKSADERRAVAAPARYKTKHPPPCIAG